MAVDQVCVKSVEDFFGHPIGIGDLHDDVSKDLLSAQTFIPLDITALRIIDGNEIHNLANHGGFLAEDSNPNLMRYNGATDKALRVTWTAENDEIEVQFPPVMIPPDLDDGENVVVHLLLAREAANDDCQVDVQAFQNAVGTYASDTEMGGKTTALTTTDVEEKTVTLAAADIAAHPGFLNISLVPDAHATDDLYLYGAWIEYTRKLRTS